MYLTSGGKRHQTNKNIVVSILYKLCYALSQKCNFLQKDNSLFMISNNLNKEAMNTERQLGNTCSAHTGYRMLQEAESKHRHMLNEAIREAIKQKWFIVATIDDYMSIKTHRRPTEDKASTAINMGTVVVSIYDSCMDIPKINKKNSNFRCDQ